MEGWYYMHGMCGYCVRIKILLKDTKWDCNQTMPTPARVEKDGNKSAPLTKFNQSILCQQYITSLDVSVNFTLTM